MKALFPKPTKAPLFFPLVQLTAQIKKSRFFFKATKKPSNPCPFVHQYLEESQIEKLYQSLHGLFRVSMLAFRHQKDQGKIKEVLHPVEEQNWYIAFLKKNPKEYTSNEILTVILNCERCDQYLRYLHQEEDWQAFEIFIQNFWIPALSEEQLAQVFLLAYQDELDRSVLLKRLFLKLPCQSAHPLLKAVKAKQFAFALWKDCCLTALEAMRNAQIKQVISLIPAILEECALEKLYPCEILEVIEMEKDEKRKAHLVHKILKDCTKWWHNFSYEEIRETKQILINSIKT